jgi:deoxyribodipyrimidine photo-lyase
VSQSPVLLWFRLDLRLEDNPALSAAAESGRPLVPVFLWDPDGESPWPPGSASQWWLHWSLLKLDESLRSRGSRLVIRRGATWKAIRELISETDARAIYWNRRYEPTVLARDRTITKELSERDIEVRTFNSGLLFEPGTIHSGNGRPYQVFSAFWKACLSHHQPPSPARAPGKWASPSGWPRSEDISDLELLPRVNWAAGWDEIWRPGETGATRTWQNFLNSGFKTYSPERDLPERAGTSRLSPHLHFGEISPRHVWHDLRAARRDSTAESVDTYLRELGWREFAYHLLFHFPQITNEPLRREFLKFPWRVDADLLKRWHKGKTGYPLVDAGMRQLWATGWMHNRVRLVTASFLTKHLQMNWEEGAYWFWDTLVDADLANNTLGWQWSAGCGADAAPYFRIFNPVLQGEKFDRDGEFIRRWVPELKRLPAPWIHKPWATPQAVLAEADVRPGDNYPLPVVNHEQARREALEAFEKIKATGRE